MRVNIEDDLWESGRLRKLAMVLGVSEELALGRLVGVYRRTQTELIVTDSIDRVHTIICVDFADDDDARRFLFAMASANLATIEGEKITIRGNQNHVDRFRDHQAKSAMGGKRSHEKRQQIREAQVEHRSTTGQPQVNTPISDLLNTDLRPPSKPRPKRLRYSEETRAEVLPVAQLRLDLLKAKGFEVTDRVSDQAIADAKKIHERWPVDWDAIVRFFLAEETPWLLQHKWPYSSLLRFADDYELRWRNRGPAKPKATVREKTLAQILAEQA